MKKLAVIGLTLAIALAVATSATDVNWQKIGTSSFTGDTTTFTDYNRIKSNYLTTDWQGNIYATAHNKNNNGYQGGVTIYKNNGGSYQKIDVDLNALGYQGAVTKMQMGFDGRVYAVQNWCEINWSGAQNVNRILAIDSDGNVEKIWDAGPNDPANRIGGMAIGGDGNVYWTMNGSSNYWKNNFFWRYDVAAGIVQQAYPNVNQGWLENTRMMELEYVGNNYFAIVDYSSNGDEWWLSSIKWSAGANNEGMRHIAKNGSTKPGWGRDWVTGIVYDDTNKRLWIGGRGDDKANVMSRYDGDPNNPGLFTHLDMTDDKTAGIISNTMWHALEPDQIMNGEWWTSAMAIESATGECWMAFSGEDTFDHAYRGHVITRDAFGGMTDEGLVEIGADVVGLSFYDGTPYALVFNRTTGEYSVYAGNAVPEPGTMAALGTGLIGLIGFARRRK